MPLRIEIGPKDIENQNIVVAKRYNLEKISLGFTEIEKIAIILDEIQVEMLKKAKKQANFACNRTTKKSVCHTLGARRCRLYRIRRIISYS